MRESEVTQNLQRIRGELPSGVELIAVSKGFPFADIEVAHRAGQRHFGENRVGELLGKAPRALGQEMQVQWHFIGKIQSNKLKKLLSVPGLRAIHSVISFKQIELLKKFAPNLPRPVEIYLQVKTSAEEEKDGFCDLQELRQAVEECQGISASFPLVGLMTMGAIRTSDFAASARECFERLRDMRDQLDPSLQLSMGMSQDYPIAVALGADIIRVGTGIFGPR